MSRINGNTKIAGNFKVDDWKALRLRLLGDELDNPEAWQEAYALFLKRIQTRFIEPINRIL